MPSLSSITPKHKSKATKSTAAIKSWAAAGSTPRSKVSRVSKQRPQQAVTLLACGRWVHEFSCAEAIHNVSVCLLIVQPHLQTREFLNNCLPRFLSTISFDPRSLTCLHTASNYVHLVDALDRANLDVSIFSIQTTSFWCMNGRFESPFRCKDGCVSGSLCSVRGETETQDLY